MIFCPCIRSHCRDVILLLTKHFVGLALRDFFENGCVYVLVKAVLLFVYFTVILASYS